jgi:hypothetical protein
MYEKWLYAYMKIVYRAALARDGFWRECGAGGWNIWTSESSSAVQWRRLMRIEKLFRVKIVERMKGHGK